MKKQIGYKAGSESGKKPYTAPDSASSKSFANIVYGISEGEIAGFVNGDQSIILDNTPVQSISGDYNITDVEVDYRLGTNDQTFMPGFPSVVNEIGYSNVEIQSSNNFVHYINDLNVNAARVRFTWGKIFKQNPDNGDVHGYRIEYAIDVQTDGNGFVEVLKTALNDKTSNGYQRQHRIELPPAEIGWEIRVRRLTPNQTSDFIGDKMYLTAVAEIIDSKLRYPNTAIIGLKFDADKFGSIPKADFRLRGKLIKVPTNYNPETRTYSTSGLGTTNGVWDGTFKLAYSNNPAWIFYDLVLSRRYGLGDRIDASMLDKWSLYSIAQHCDVMVPDGLGGVEPRLTCNVYLNNKFEAFELLMQLVSTFQGIIHWEGSSIVCTADRPTDPVYTFTRSNIIGEFNYSGTRARDRHSLFSVAFDDPANNYKTDKEVVSSSKAISEVGVRVKELTAFGCTSRGQAQRIGRRALLKEQEETRMVTFAVGLEGYIPITGKIIEIADPLLAGRAIGGRVSVVSSDNLLITVDRDIEPSLEGNKRLVINGDDGIQQSRDIVGINGRVVTVSAAFVGVSAEHVWAIDSDDLKLMRFRVLSVSQNRSDSGTISFTVSAVQHNPDTQDSSDNSTYIEPPNYSNIDIYTQETVKNFLIDSENTINQGIDITNVVFSWDQAKGAVKYELEWRRDNGTWIKAPLIYSNTYTVENVYHGVYEARIVAINAMDVRSLYVVANPKVINSKFAEPPMLSALSISGQLFGVVINWSFPAVIAQNALYTKIEVSYRADKADAKLLGDFAYPLNRTEITGLQGNLQVWVRARIIDRNEVEGPWFPWVSAVTEADAEKILDMLDGQLSETQLNQDLITKIEAGVEAGTAAENAQSAADQAQAAADSAAAAALSAQTLANTAQAAASNAQTTATNAQTLANTAQAAASNAQTTANNAAAEVQQLVQDVDADITALSTDLNSKVTTLNNGLTQEITDRQNADTQIVGQLNAYKTSNDAAVASVLQKAEAATTASTANAQTLTNLTATVNTKNRTYRQNAAPTAGLIVGDLWINTTAGKNNEVRRWNGTAWDDLTDPRTAANATAITNLQTTVTNIDGRTTANANSITQLRTDLTTLSNTVGTKADASALTSLQATVTQQGNDIVSNTSALTSLQSQVTTNTNNIANKLDASVITNYYTKTEANAATAGAIQTYDTSLVIGGENLYLGANPITLSGRAGELNVVANDVNTAQLFKYLTADELDITQLAVGDKTVSSMEFFIPSSTNNDFEFMFATYRFSHTSYMESGRLKASQFPRDKWFRLALASGALPDTAVAASNINISLYVYRRYVGDTIKWRNLMLEKGTKASAYSEPTSVLKANIAANSTAITQTKADVTTLNGTVTAQGTQLTNLTSRVTTVENGLATKADATALTNLTTRVTAAEGNITSQGTQLTTLRNDLTVTTTTANNALPKISSAGAYKAFRNVLNNITMVGTIPATTNLVISTPITFTAKMTNLSIKGYMYKGTNDTAIDLRVGFYAYSLTTPFLNRSVVNNGSFPFKVRLGVKDEKAVVILSSVGAVPTMSYPQFGVDAEFGYSLAPDTWKDGWACAQVTEDDLATFGVTSIQTPPIFDPKTEITANATALTSLTNTVTQQGTQIDSHSTQLTTLNNSITSINSTLATKADSSALTTLESKVTANTNNITAQGTQLTQLGNRVTTVENGLTNKADAAALTNLATRVTATENSLTTQATQTTKLTAAISSISEGLKLTGTSDAIAQSSRATDAKFLLVAESSAASGYVMRLGNDSGGNDGVSMLFQQTAPIDANKLYRVRYRYRRVAGAGGMYMGISPLTADKLNGVATNGALMSATAIGSMHYFVTNAQPALGVWTEGVYYFKGKASEGTNSAGSGTIVSPRTFVNNAAFMRIGILPNFTNQSGIQDVDYIVIEDAEAIAAADANATAITTTNTEVSRINGVVVAQGTSITNLQAGLTTANNNIATKADASALQQLDNRVSVAEGNITSNSTAITNLQNRVTTTENGLSAKADASALSALQSTVTQQGNTQTSQGNQITTLNNSLAITTATANAALPKISALGGNNTKIFRSVLTYDLRVASATGNIVIQTPITFSARMFTLTGEGYSYRAGKTDINFRAGGYAFSGASLLSHSATNLGSMPITFRFGVRNGCVCLILTSQDNNQWSHVKLALDAQIGYTVPPDTWADGWTAAIVLEADLATYGITNIVNTSQVDMNTSIAANASAITSLTNTVTQQGNSITSQSDQITSLNNSITTINGTLSTKADSSALTTLASRVTTNEGSITSLSNQTTTLSNRMTTAEGNISTTSNTLNTLNNTVTDIDGRVTVQGTALTKVESDLSGMVIGGANLWSLQTTGRYSAGVITAPHGSVTVSGNEITYATKGTSDRIGCNAPITSGQPITIRFKPVTGVSDGIVYFRALTSTGAQADSQKTAAATLKDGYYTVTLPSTQFPATTASVNFGLGGAGTGTIVVSEVTIQYGNKATAWTDSYRDIPVIDLSGYATTAALSTLDAKVTNIDGRVTANSTQLTQLNSSLTTTNNNVTAAQNAADAAATLAGSKGKVIVQTAAPAVADRLTQNLWIDITGNANTPKRWNGTAWVAVTDKVATDAAAAAANALSTANTKADASVVSTLSTKVDTVEGNVNSQATQLTSLTTTVGNHTASISTLNTSVNGLSAKATIQVAAGNTVGGVSLGNDQGVVDFIVRANTFAIAPPVGSAGSNKYAFQYRSTSVTLPNGVVVPAGLYLDNATIDYIDASKIYATSLSAISAVLGTLITYKNPANPNGARMILEGSLIRVYDDNNVMRVRLGLWDL